MKLIFIFVFSFLSKKITAILFEKSECLDEKVHDCVGACFNEEKEKNEIKTLKKELHDLKRQQQKDNEKEKKQEPFCFNPFYNYDCSFCNESEESKSCLFCNECFDSKEDSTCSKTSVNSEESCSSLSERDTISCFEKPYIFENKSGLNVISTKSIIKITDKPNKNIIEIKENMILISRYCGVVHIKGDKNKIYIVGEKNKVKVNGSVNRITVHGASNSIFISGKGNKIKEFGEKNNILIEENSSLNKTSLAGSCSKIEIQGPQNYVWIFGKHNNVTSKGDENVLYGKGNLHKIFLFSSKNSCTFEDHAGLYVFIDKKSNNNKISSLGGSEKEINGFILVQGKQNKIDSITRLYVLIAKEGCHNYVYFNGTRSKCIIKGKKNKIFFSKKKCKANLEKEARNNRVYFEKEENNVKIVGKKNIIICNEGENKVLFKKCSSKNKVVLKGQKNVVCIKGQENALYLKHTENKVSGNKNENRIVYI